MSYTIVSDVCEGVGDCIPLCPEECIHLAKSKRNVKGTKCVYIDDSKCTDCDACLFACPISGAVLDRWVPVLQKR